MTVKIHMDFETFSEADLFKVGAWVYSQHESTRVICMAWAVDSEPPVLWLPLFPFPDRLRQLLKAGAVVTAWNSFFEWCIWHNTLQWDALSLSQWSDTMAKAAVHNLPQALEKCGDAIGLGGDQAKSKRGKYLINKLSIPDVNGERSRDKVLEREMFDYCLQDVVAERTIDRRLGDLSADERQIWELDQEMNIRGTYIDVAACSQALPILEQAKGKLREEVQLVTNGALTTTNSSQKVRGWFDMVHGYSMDAYTKYDVKVALRDPECPECVRQVLRIRQKEGKTSTAKYTKLRLITANDYRAHGLLAHHAAFTGRWGGRMFQPHNLPRPDIALKQYATEIIDAFHWGKAEALEMCFGEPMECLSTALRGMIIAPPGQVLYVGDYKQIEARALVWLAQQLDTLSVFTRGEDVYRHTAAIIFNTHPSLVTDEQRFIGKIATLALGYQGGGRAFVKMAEDFDVAFEFDTAENIKLKWRTENADVVQFWYALERAAVNAVQNPHQDIVVDAGLRNIKFHMGKQFLHLILPSGRHLYYYHAIVTGGNDGWSSRLPQVRYMGTNPYTKQWQWIEQYGGKWAQNVCEGVCRDLLAGSMRDIQSEGFDMVLSVHDEAIAEGPPGHLQFFTKVMERQPGWSDGLPVGVDAFAATRYRK